MTNAELGAPDIQPRVLPTVGPGGPCAPARGEVDTRCADAERLANAAQSHQQALRDGRLEHAAVTRLRDSDARLRDGRRLAEQKAEAQAGYHSAVVRAADESAVQQAAAAWLRRLDQLNREARAADARADSVTQRMAELERALPGLELVADAARIAAEAAHVGCLDARRTLAACEEAQQRAASSGARAALSTGPLPPGAPPPSQTMTPSNGTPTAPRPASPAHQATGTAPASGTAQGWSSSASAQPAAEWRGMSARVEVPAGRPASTWVDSPAQVTPPVETDSAAIGRAARALMRGDRQTLLGLAQRLAEETGFEAGRLQLLLLELREQIAGRALEDFCFSHPEGHPFWSQFTSEAAREVAAGLASLGYRFDGRDGWLDNRSPQVRDLALALSYCGYDPRTLRRPAGQPALEALWTGSVLRSEDYLLSVAPDLALNQIVAMLGPRSSQLAELWDSWGRLRPLLMRTA